jgi:hypothetical protein
VTTKANKFGLRKAAEERTNRHAQRTPLPAKAERIADAKEVLATIQQDFPSVKSWGKAQSFKKFAELDGWDVELKADGERVTLLATRAEGVEALHQSWLNGVWQYEASTYSFADRTTRPRNASGATKLLSRTHEAAAAEMNKVAANTHFRKREPREVTTMVLPFDPKEASEAEIIGFLRGQTVAWYNRLSRGSETAMISRTSTIWVTEYYGERTVTVCCPVTGFRSFRLSALQRVGRGHARKTDGGNLLVEMEDAA